MKVDIGKFVNYKYCLKSIDLKNRSVLFLASNVSNEEFGFSKMRTFIDWVSLYTYLLDLSHLLSVCLCLFLPLSF